MNKLFLFKYFILSVLMTVLLFSCSDNTNNNKGGEVTFKVFECNEPFVVENSASARFVSDNAEITIWEKQDSIFAPVKKITTSSDGTVHYKYDSLPVYYTVSKTIDREDGDSITKQNLYYLKIKNLETGIEGYLKFQIDGIFTSEDDIASHASFNIPPDMVKYIPHVGTLKLKDMNNDYLIDERDAVEISQIKSTDQEEEIIYLSGATVILK